MRTIQSAASSETTRRDVVRRDTGFASQTMQTTAAAHTIHRYPKSGSAPTPGSRIPVRSAHAASAIRGRAAAGTASASRPSEVDAEHDAGTIHTSQAMPMK